MKCIQAFLLRCLQPGLDQVCALVEDVIWAGCPLDISTGIVSQAAAGRVVLVVRPVSPLHEVVQVGGRGAALVL